MDRDSLKKWCLMLIKKDATSRLLFSVHIPYQPSSSWRYICPERVDDPFMNHNLVVVKGFVWLNETMSHDMQGLPRCAGCIEEFWQSVVYRRREQQNPLIFLLKEPQEHYENAKRYDTGRQASQVEGVQYSTGEEQRAIINSFKRKKERKKATGLKGKWHSVVDVKSKNARERGKNIPNQMQSSREQQGDKKIFLSEQCKDVSEYNCMGKSGDLLKKFGYIKGTYFMQGWAQ